MALRLLKLILPEEQDESASAMLADMTTLDSWREESDRGQFVMSILLTSEQSEQVMDTCEKSFGHVKGFRLVLLPVEASIPRPAVQEKKEEPQAPESKPEKLPLRISREELYDDLQEGARCTHIFVALVALSTVVVALGLQRDNVALIIGAMVLAPLLGPNAALAFASTLADWSLAREALKTLGAGVFVALVTSVVTGLFMPVDPGVREIALRTQVSFGDIVLALASGCAGGLAFTTGISSALIGVMVAVALLPPLAAAGLLLGAGQYAGAAGAGLLFATNIICVNLAGVLTFILQGIRPRTWWELSRARKATSRVLALWTLLLILLVAIVWFSHR